MLSNMLEGKTVLVTGASSGIGRGVAIACASAGARCVLLARDMPRLSQVKELCVNASIEVVDVCDVVALKELVERLPVLDGVVHCAGISDKYTPLKFLNADLIDAVLGINVRAPMLLTALLEKKKKLNKGASLVMISSISSFHTSPAHSLYAASKGALTAFVKGAALDLAAKKIRVNAVAPGMINTPLVNALSVSEEERQHDIARYPLKRYGEPEDVAGMVVYLLSDVSQWVTGQQFVIDGGRSI